MKAQLTFEFIVAAVLFFSIILYIVSYLSTNVSSYRNEFYIHDLQTRVIQISELLIHNKVVGLAKDWPVLDYGKIQAFNNSCEDDYPSLLERLDLRWHKIKIRINDGEENLVDCGPSVPTGVPIVEVKRFAVLSPGNKILILDFWVW